MGWNIRLFSHLGKACFGSIDLHSKLSVNFIGNLLAYLHANLRTYLIFYRARVRVCGKKRDPFGNLSARDGKYSSHDGNSGGVTRKNRAWNGNRCFRNEIDHDWNAKAMIWNRGA